jgi:hypothetical protein
MMIKARLINSKMKLKKIKRKIKKLNSLAKKILLPIMSNKDSQDHSLHIAH